MNKFWIVVNFLFAVLNGVFFVLDTSRWWSFVAMLICSAGFGTCLFAEIEEARIERARKQWFDR